MKDLLPARMIRKRIIGATIIFFGLIGTVSSVFAQSPAAPEAQVQFKPAEVGRSETAFMKQVAENNHAELLSAQLALQKATDPKVKDFAQMMIDDHQKLGGTLQALAKAKSVELPAEPSLLQKAKMKFLEAADGKDFDHRYSESMGLNAHRENIALFEKAAREVKDQDVKNFARNAVPKLREHLVAAGTLPAPDQNRDIRMSK